MSTTLVEKPRPVTNYEVDEEGDLVLRVGSETSTCDFLVCSSTLRRASLVWKKMLYGEFREAKPAQGDWIVTLPDDDPSTMKVLLDIVHANFSDVPRQLDLPGVYTLLILMDKYDALRFVKPWARHWFSMIEAAATSTNGYHLCMAAYAALQMGAESDAYNLVSRISRNSTIDSAGKLAVHGVQLELCSMLDSVGPHSIFDIIRTMRKAQLQHVVQEVWEALNANINGVTAFKYPSQGVNSMLCDNFDFLGRFWCAVMEKRGGLFPKSPCEISESPTELIASLQAVVTRMSLDPENATVFTAALTPLGDDVLRPLWKVDAGFMSIRQKTSGIQKWAASAISDGSGVRNSLALVLSAI